LDFGDHTVYRRSCLLDRAFVRKGKVPYEPTAVVLVAAESEVGVGAETVMAGAATGWVVATPSV
jgi:hypothetical protein